MKTKDWVTDDVTLNNLSTRQVAIMGASYGGYATLAGLCFTPDVYRCGIDIVGPAHIKVGGCGWDGFWLFGVVWFVWSPDLCTCGMGPTEKKTGAARHHLCPAIASRGSPQRGFQMQLDMN